MPQQQTRRNATSKESYVYKTSNMGKAWVRTMAFEKSKISNGKSITTMYHKFKKRMIIKINIPENQPVHVKDKETSE